MWLCVFHAGKGTCPQRTDREIKNYKSNKNNYEYNNLNNKNYTVTYNWEYVEDLEKSMVDNYANYTELTKEDMNNIETNLLKLTQSELLKDILAF